jgi:hypothetical protein
VADSAPYFHDGGSATLEAAILLHNGGAASVTKDLQGASAEGPAGAHRVPGNAQSPRDALPAQSLLTEGVVAATSK